MDLLPLRWLHLAVITKFGGFVPRDMSGRLWFTPAPVCGAVAARYVREDTALSNSDNIRRLWLERAQRMVQSTRENKNAFGEGTD